MSPLRVVSVVSNKGGVGKTTLASNLAVYLRALREELPILVLGLDDQDFLERMFGLTPREPGEPTLREALAAGDLRSALRLGQYGIHYVPPSPTLAGLDAHLAHPRALRERIEALGWEGLVVIDTKSDLGALTQNALAASDLALVAVACRTSLDQAERIYELLEAWGRPRETARLVLSLVDRRVKYRAGEDADVLALLLSEIRRRGHPCFESFLSRSPKIESLATSHTWRVQSILHGAPGSLIHRQLAHLAEDVLLLLEAPAAEGGTTAPGDRRRAPRRACDAEIPCFLEGEPPILALRALDLSAGGLAVAPAQALAEGRRVHLLLDPEAGSPRLVAARVLRMGPERAALRFEAEGADAAPAYGAGAAAASASNAARIPSRSKQSSSSAAIRS